MIDLGVFIDCVFTENELPNCAYGNNAIRLSAKIFIPRASG
jgi:hypothetical protein